LIILFSALLEGLTFVEPQYCAVLVDAENVLPEMALDALRLTEEMNVKVIFQAFGDWTNIWSDWQKVVNDFGIERIQVDRTSNKKNSSDIALAIHAVKLHFENEINRFIIVSSDADFLHLVRVLTNRQCIVYGVGNELTNESLRRAYVRFFEYKSKNVSEQPVSINVPNKGSDPLNDYREKLLALCLKYANQHGWVSISSLGTFMHMKKCQLPDGFNKLIKVLTYFKNDFEVNNTHTLVRAKYKDVSLLR